MPPQPGPTAQALETIWGRLRARHADLPPTRITITPRRAPEHSVERMGRTPEGIVTGPTVGAPTLVDGPLAVLTLVHHEAAHVLAYVRDIRDTTSRGRYHNGAFRELAEEVGFVWPAHVTHIPHRGWWPPPLPASVVRPYRDLMPDLGRAIETSLQYLRPPSATPTRRRATIRCTCEPPRTALMGPTVLAAGPVICGVCGNEFETRE